METDLQDKEMVYQEKLYDEKAYQEKLTKFYQRQARRLDNENKKLIKQNKAHKKKVQNITEENEKVSKLYREIESYIKVIYPQKAAPSDVLKKDA